MAKKDICIHIKSGWDGSGVKAANLELAKLAQEVGHTNEALRQATLRQANNVYSIAAEADKACRAMGGGYKTLDEFAKMATKAGASAGSAGKQVGGLSNAGELLTKCMSAGRGSIEGFVGLLMQLAKATGVAKMALGPLAAIVGAFALVVKRIGEVRTQHAELAAEVEKAKKAEVDKHLEKIAEAQSSITKAMGDTCKAVDQSLAKAKEYLDVQREILKSELELAKQRELSAASGNKETEALIEKKYDLKAANADAKTSEEKLALEYDAARRKVEANRQAINASNDWQGMAEEEVKRLQGKIDTANEHARKAVATGSASSVQEYMSGSKEGQEAKEAQKQIEKINKLRGEEEKTIKRLREERAELTRSMDVVADKMKAGANNEEARLLKAERETAAKAREIDRQAAKEAHDEELAALKREKEEEAKRRQERIDGLRAEKTAAAGRAAAIQATAGNAPSRAETELQAFRDAAIRDARISEEKARAEALDNVQKQVKAQHLTGQVDSLAKIYREQGEDAFNAEIAARRNRRTVFATDGRGGVTYGFKDAAQEQLVRTAAAFQAGTSVEESVRKIEAHTRDLDKKIDQLLTMK